MKTIGEPLVYFGYLAYCVSMWQWVQGEGSIFYGVAPFQFGNGYFSVCAQIKINLLIYPTLLGLHLYDLPQHHPWNSGCRPQWKTRCTIKGCG